jgi:hypothetical protein
MDILCRRFQLNLAPGIVQEVHVYAARNLPCQANTDYA